MSNTNCDYESVCIVEKESGGTLVFWSKAEFFFRDRPVFLPEGCVVYSEPEEEERRKMGGINAIMDSSSPTCILYYTRNGNWVACYWKSRSKRPAMGCVVEHNVVVAELAKLKAWQMSDFAKLPDVVQQDVVRAAGELV